MNGHAMQCRVTTEDPENNFIPDYGRITAYRSPAGFGIRLDAGTAYAGAFITRSYDSLLVKVTAWAPTPEEAIARMHRALWEFRMRGVVTNLRFLDQLITHPRFRERRLHDQVHRRDAGAVPLRAQARPRDAAAALRRRRDRQRQPGGRRPRAPEPASSRRGRRRLPAERAAAGTKQRLDELGADEVRAVDARAARGAAHRHDLPRRAPVAAGDAHAHPRHGRRSRRPTRACCRTLLGRVLGRRDLRRRDALPARGCPWERLAAFREAMPNLLLQMLLRSANAVGYTNYPDNVVRYFVAAGRADTASTCSASSTRSTGSRTCASRSTPCCETGKLCEAAICYTGNLTDPRRTEVRPQVLRRAWRSELEQAGAHILGIKDMAGLCQPRAAHTLVKALKEEIGLPIHFHTHDTSGIAAASVLAAVEAGVRRGGRRDRCDERPHLAAEPRVRSSRRCATARATPASIRTSCGVLSNYWEQVRHGYAAFESDMRSGASEVYVHGMPGGQYTNLREQARSLGIDDTRWHEVARAYAAGERDVRRHRQGDAVVEGRRRHGDHDGHERAHRRATCSIPTTRGRLPRVGRVVVPRRHRAAVRRLSARRCRRRC